MVFQLSKPPASLWTPGASFRHLKHPSTHPEHPSWRANGTKKPHPSAGANFHRHQPAQLFGKAIPCCFSCPGQGPAGKEHPAGPEIPAPHLGCYTHSVARLWKSVSSTPWSGGIKAKPAGKERPRGGSAAPESPKWPQRAAFPCPRAVTSRRFGAQTPRSRGAGSAGILPRHREGNGSKAELTSRRCRCPGPGRAALMSPRGQDARGLWELQFFSPLRSRGLGSPFPPGFMGTAARAELFNGETLPRWAKSAWELGKCSSSSPVRSNFQVIKLR